MKKNLKSQSICKGASPLAYLQFDTNKERWQTHTHTSVFYESLGIGPWATHSVFAASAGAAAAAALLKKKKALHAELCMIGTNVFLQR